MTKSAGLFLIANFFMALTVTSHAADGNLVISRQAGPWPIVIKTCAHDAGAICSLRWRGKEFIDDYDHGRQLQSAVVFDRTGETFNPTEAGASFLTDGINPHPSSSVLQASWSMPNILATQTRMAFWNPVNGQRTSNHILNKRVTIGAFGLAHVIEYANSFTIPANERHSHGQFEIVTGYMPYEFSKFWTYNVRTKSLRALGDGPGEQGLPVILSTQDEGWAMGIYSAEHKRFGRWRFGREGVVKWNNVARVNNPRAGGVYSFRSYVVVGSLQNVRVSMDQLYSKLGK